MIALNIILAFVALVVTVATTPEIIWKDAHELGLGGLAFADQVRELPYDRLPAAAKSSVTPEVWAQSIESAGVHVDFETDAKEIWIHYDLVQNTTLVNMDTIGVSGVDIFAFDPTNGVFRWLNAWTTVKYPTNEGMIVNYLDFAVDKTLYRINFPLYNRVSSFRVGVPKDGVKVFSTPTSAAPDTKPAPIVWYGTSIAQGKAAQVPSSAYMTQLNVANYPKIDILNFGFSGNGKMDSAVMAFLNAINPTPAAYIIDCLPNMTADEVAERTVPLVRGIRATHTGQMMPIVLVESATYANEWFNSSAASGQQKKRDALRESYEVLLKEGVRGLQYVYGKALIPNDKPSSIAYQVDGTHPTDLGMHSMFLFWTDYINNVLFKSVERG